MPNILANWPNRITTLRAFLVVCLVGLVLFETAVQSWLCYLALIAWALDGLDGWLARKFGQETEFGARFDMEVDAAFMLLLPVLLVWLERFSVLLVVVGLFRYLFIAAGWCWSWLQRPLPPSFRRKFCCALAILLMILMLHPAISDGGATGLGLITLGLIVYSFLVDVIWLHKNRS